eukprot:TRINITY_DN33068_c0_g1_i1.p1 TRINITY_DN33068_c0_g1~~TRINITY_DN33068_c0_g1_i1.p1  ORF type:complete len:409 (+),score=41.51 TRINITY_DN33068_c0_g1_i1:144-1370(+)
MARRREMALSWRQAVLALAGVLGLSRAQCLIPHPTEPRFTLEGTDIQVKLVRFYAGDGPPPLEEVFFATQTLTPETEERLMQECPGLLMTAFALLAEARLPVDEEEGTRALKKVKKLSESLPEDEYHASMQIWPLKHALGTYALIREDIRQLRSQNEGRSQRVQIVVSHCQESLDFLVDGRLRVPTSRMSSLELYVYERCGRHFVQEQDLRYLLTYHRATVVEVGDAGEQATTCAAYLRHLVDHYANPPDYMLFLGADAVDHLHWGYLALVLRAIGQGTLMAPFVHLSKTRLLGSPSTCSETLFREVFGRAPQDAFGSYCCSQFVISKERFLANSREMYQRILDVMNASPSDDCRRAEGSSANCVALEPYWQVLFGEDEALPERLDNGRLPTYLRSRDLDSSLYLSMA